MKDYTYTTAKCVVVTIEAVFDLQSGIGYDDVLTNALSELREEGVAAVIRKEVIADTYEDATTILESKTIQGGEYP